MKEYKRMTKRKEDCGWEFEKCNQCSHCEVAYCDNAEDAITRLAELEDKIENGTLVEFPCKVGDKVYQFDNGGEIYESEIKGLIYDCGNFAFDERAIGTSIFLTKAEAEARLKALDNSYKE